MNNQDDTLVGHEVYTQELFLANIKKLAESQELGLSIDTCVISVPSDLDDSAMTNLPVVKSAKKAGFEYVFLVKECIALILGHDLCTAYTGNCNEQSPKVALTVNIGQNYTEYALVKINQGSLKVIDAKRIEMGGESLTRKIFDHVKKRFMTTSKLDSDIFGKNSERRLLEVCEEAKKNLFNSGSANVLCESLCVGMDCNIPISIGRIDDCNEELYKMLTNEVHAFISKNNINVNDVSYLILAGGSMKMQKIQSLYKKNFPNSTVYVGNYPEESVVNGCCAYASKITSLSRKKALSLIRGTTCEAKLLNSAINLFLENGSCLELFPINTTIPSFAKVNLNLSKNQDTIHVAIGEKSPIIETVLATNIDDLSNNSSPLQLLVVIENESLIKINLLHNDSIINSQEIAVSL